MKQPLAIEDGKVRVPHQRNGAAPVVQPGQGHDPLTAFLEKRLAKNRQRFEKNGLKRGWNRGSNPRRSKAVEGYCPKPRAKSTGYYDNQ